MATRKIAPALAPRSTCVVKPAGETRLSMLAFAELVQRAGFPDGCVNVVTSLHNVAQVRRAMCEHLLIRKVSLTGSKRVGKLIAAQSATSLKKLSMELGGGKSPARDCDERCRSRQDGSRRSCWQTCPQLHRRVLQRNGSWFSPECTIDFVQALPKLVLSFPNGPSKSVTRTSKTLSPKAPSLLHPSPTQTYLAHFYPPTILTNLTRHHAHLLRTNLRSLSRHPQLRNQTSPPPHHSQRNRFGRLRLHQRPPHRQPPLLPPST